VHDLSPHSIKNLQTGLIDIVLDSNPMQQVLQAVAFISKQHGYLAVLDSSVVDFQLYTSDNLPRTQFI
jgi:ABC-type sugar transport system substrate-binding protein